MNRQDSNLGRWPEFALTAILCMMAAALPLACGRGRADIQAADKAMTKDETMVFKRIGVIHSPYTPEKGAPKQGRLAPDVGSTIVVDGEYEAGLTDIETFNHIIVIYAFDRSEGWSPMVKTPWEEKKHGVFATRSPRRPNPIGMTVAKLVKREGLTLHVEGLDAFDGTPLLDLKPYVPKFDSMEDGGGWLQDSQKGSAPGNREK